MSPRYLFFGTLVQESSASFGGQEAEGWVDAALCRDGKGRYTLRGEGQAGALLSLARKLFKTLPSNLDRRNGQGGRVDHRPSAWRTYTTHPEPDSLGEAEPRQCVRIDPRTAAADDGALFDLETLPKGVRWPFLLELDTALVNDGEAHRAAAITAHVLRAWAAGYAWFGRGAARGLGWFTLKDARVLTLNDGDVWPNAFTASPFAYAAELWWNAAAEPGPKRAVDLAAFLASPERGGISSDGDWCWRTYDLALNFGAADPEGYGGLGALSIGSHAGYDLAPPFPEDGRLLTADGLSKPEGHWRPDRYVATTGADSPLPYIPGSSLRGPLRHRLEWWLGRLGRQDTDRETCRKLFGHIDKPQPQSAALLIRDAFPDPESGWRMALLPSHAEDEFSAGTYNNALYNRLAVLNAVFRTRVVLEAPNAAELAELERLFEPARRLAEQGFVAVGGAGRHGFGHGRWKFEEPESPVLPTLRAESP